MSDHGTTPDPIDQAYVQAEAMLSDDEVRAARRARVLAAVASEAETAPAAPLPAIRRAAWRRGRWLAAAGVAGLGLILATQIYPGWRQPQTTTTTPAPKVSAPAEDVTASASSAAVASAQAPPPPPPVERVRRPVPLPMVQPPVVAPPAPPPSEPAAVAAAPQAFPDAAPAPPPAAAQSERESDEALAAQSPAPRAKVPVAVSAFTGPSQRVGRGPLAAGPLDPPQRLRAAAGAGRTAEVRALLLQGVPIDAADTDGKTALMRSIETDWPAVAALLRRHGASLDQRDNAGQSARDMAAAKADPALDQALGLAP